MKITIALTLCLWGSGFNFCQGQTPESAWTYIEIDHQKAKWGDYADPAWLRYFGLDMGDLNADGFMDIISGRSVYLNPKGDMSGHWQKVDLGLNVDGILIMDVDGDDFGDIIAQALPDVYWLEATTKDGSSWKSLKIGEVPATSHVNSQGFERVQLIAGGRSDLS